MSRRQRVVLITLVWVVAAGLMVLPVVCPPYAHFLDREQWPLGVLTGATLGWNAKGVTFRKQT